jgi:hypothetical protein
MDVSFVQLEVTRIHIDQAAAGAPPHDGAGASEPRESVLGGTRRVRLRPMAPTTPGRPGPHQSRRATRPARSGLMDVNFVQLEVTRIHIDQAAARAPRRDGAGASDPSEGVLGGTPASS